MHDNLIEYVIGLLDDQESLILEQALARDPQLQSQLELIRQALAPLEPLRRDADAPQGLAIRTCVRIRQMRQNPNA